MTQPVLVKFESDSGPILVEVAEVQVGPLPAAAGNAGVKDSGRKFMEAMSGIRPIAEAVLAQIEGLAPSEAKVEFGVKLTGKAGVVLASAESEAHLKITLTWTKGS